MQSRNHFGNDEQQVERNGDDEGAAMRSACRKGVVVMAVMMPVTMPPVTMLPLTMLMVIVMAMVLMLLC